MTEKPKTAETVTPDTTPSEAGAKSPKKVNPQKEVGGREGPEPTRYGDWEKNGIISDF
jgi:hypothetical protein